MPASPHSSFRRLTLRVLFVLAAVLAAFNPASARTYVVVLKYPLPLEYPQLDLAQIANADGNFGIPEAGFGGYVDRGFVSMPRVSETQLRGDFGPALDAMAEILSRGLPPLAHSYAVLLDNQPAPPGSLQVTVHGKSSQVTEAGQAMYLDGYSAVPYMAPPGQLKDDFGGLMLTLAAARKAGLPMRSYVVLLENPDGTAGKILVTDETGTTTLDQPGQARRLDPGQAGTFRAGGDLVQADFDAALKARPPLPGHLTLFFELGSTHLTPDSQAGLDKFLLELRDRPMPEISVEGHTDTVGSDAFNDKLALERAEFVAKRIGQVPIAAELVKVTAYGKRQPLVVTPDRTPEQKNRRVEISVR